MTDPRVESPPTNEAPLPRPRVLVVDDDHASCRLLVRTLEAIGYTAEGASDGTQALEMIASHAPEIVLLDLDLPGLSGSEVCTRLRHHRREELRNIPVVMLTAHDGESEEVVCLQAGANDFMAKPIGRAVLAARIATQLRLRSLNEALRLQKEELERWRAAQIADLEAAQRVQRAILPASRDLPGWQVDVEFLPVIHVGGDIYGVEAMRGGQLMWLADATGHGVAAALCTTLVALLFQRAATSSDPARVLARVNAEMVRIFHRRSMLSAACVRLSPDGELRFAGAGHPPLFIRRRDGQVESFASQGTLLGVIPDCAFSTATLQLAPGDTALLLSDGLYSARHADGERCSIEDVAKTFAEKPEVGSLLGRMRSAGAFDDDVTVLAATRIA